MAQAVPEWVVTLGQVNGLTDDERAEAEVLIFAMPEGDRLPYVSGAPDQVLKRIKARLRSAGGEMSIQQHLI